MAPRTPHANDASDPPSLTLTLLGPTRIARDAAPLAFAYAKVQALLVFLAVEANRAHRRAALADLLWPEQGEAAARHSLSQALWSLRRALRDTADTPLLLATRDTVRLNPLAPTWLDVAAFHQLCGGASGDTQKLQQAIALYRGEFLEGWGIGESAAFEEWALLTREHLRGQACEVLRQLAGADLALGDGMQAASYAGRWVALDPLSEDAHRRLMRALAESDQRTAALAAFAHCRRVLHDELGIEPEPATIALYEELKRGDTPVLAPATPVPPTLPLPLTRLIDRERELAELAALLADPANRLLTIIGPGGVGKTCLVLHAAAASAPSFADGVCFVPLAPVRDPRLVLAAIAQALGVPQNDARPPDELVGATLAQRRLLLLLDNCEHLLPEAATLLAALLTAAPAVTVLATSRAALRLFQERRYQLAPLTLPEGDGLIHVGQVQPGAVALFVERAQAARPAVELDYATVGAICRRLDGLPLAIELAATRVRLLNPRALLERLEPCLPLLSGGPRDLPERHQTLYATIDWSYQLLHPHQRALFRRLAVFAGGWTVAAAEAVCADTLDTPPQSVSVLDGLAALLDANLIMEMTSDGEPRCAMLETVREFAHAQLVAHDEFDRAQELHARYALALAAQLNSPSQHAWLTRLDAELDNVRAALNWCSEHDVGVGLRLASDLSRFWDIRGYWREGRDWLETLLRQDECQIDPTSTSEERALGLRAAGSLATFLNDFVPAAEHLHKSLTLYRQLEDHQRIGHVLSNLGNVALGRGAYPEAEQLYRESLAMRRRCNHTVGMAASLNNVALAIRMRGDLRTANDHYEQSLALYRQVGDRAAEAWVMNHIAAILLLQNEHILAQQMYETSHATAHELGYKPAQWRALSGLGDVARMQQRYGEAKSYYGQSLALSAASHNVGGVAHNVFCLAVVTRFEGRTGRAVVLLSTSAALHRSAHIAQTPEDATEFTQHLAVARTTLDATTFEAEWARGQVLSLEQAVALAIDDALC